MPLLSVVACAAALSALSGAFTASATTAPTGRRTALIAHVPAEQAAAFAVLRDPRAARRPYRMRLALSVMARRWYGANSALARAVAGAGAAQGAPWYVVPGATGLCLYVGPAFMCDDTDEALAGRMHMDIGHGDSRTVIGLAPDGVVGVTAITSDGTAVGGTLADNTYMVAAPSIVRLQLDRLGAPPLVVIDRGQAGQA